MENVDFESSAKPMDNLFHHSVYPESVAGRIRLIYWHQRRQ